jgi:hypothetical protein
VPIWRPSTSTRKRLPNLPLQRTGLRSAAERLLVRPYPITHGALAR